MAKFSNIGLALPQESCQDPLDLLSQRTAPYHLNGRLIQMRAERLQLTNIGPIANADIAFGDLTILVGPQATGKSIFLQFLKLLLDAGPILGYLNEHGLNWHQSIEEFLELYLGEGTGKIWHARKSRIVWKRESIDLEAFVKSKRQSGSERSLLIPAQRVMAFSRDGWFRPFNDYRAGDPFSIRDFSEKLRRLMESEGGRNAAIYPQQRKLNQEIRELLSGSIFGGFQLELDRSGPQKRLVLHRNGTQIPFMVWSSGQREFVPLLLGLYLLPATGPTRAEPVKWVMIEELEMALHPKAIAALYFIVLELMSRGYKVCLSTHSPQILDLVWAIRNLRDHGADPAKVLALFDAKPTPSMMKVARSALEKVVNVYYFNPELRITRDISELDPAAADVIESGWGGLTELSGKAADLVAEAADAQRRL